MKKAIVLALAVLLSAGAVSANNGKRLLQFGVHGGLISNADFESATADFTLGAAMNVSAAKNWQGTAVTVTADCAGVVLGADEKVGADFLRLLTFLFLVWYNTNKE